MKALKDFKIRAKIDGILYNIAIKEGDDINALKIPNVFLDNLKTEGVIKQKLTKNKGKE